MKELLGMRGYDERRCGVMARCIDAELLAKTFMQKGKDKLRLATVINEIELAPTVKLKLTSEIAKEIFTDILEDCFDQFGYFDYDAFAQIKKKYIGVTANEQQQTDTSGENS